MVGENKINLVLNLSRITNIAEKNLKFIHVEGKLDNYSTTLEPIQIDNEVIEVNKSISWELPQKDWKNMKLKRIPIKLLYTMSNLGEDELKSFGYSIIDLPSRLINNSPKIVKIHGTKQRLSPTIECQLKIHGFTGPTTTPNDPFPNDFYVNISIESAEKLIDLVPDDEIGEVGGSLVVIKMNDNHISQGIVNSLEFENFQNSFKKTFPISSSELLNEQIEIFFIHSKQLLGQTEINLSSLLRNGDANKSQKHSGEIHFRESKSSKIAYSLSISLSPMINEMQEKFLSTFPTAMDLYKFLIFPTFSEVFIARDKFPKYNFSLSFYISYSFTSLSDESHFGSMDLIELNNQDSTVKLDSNCDPIGIIATPMQLSENLENETMTIELYTHEKDPGEREILSKSSVNLRSLLLDRDLTGRLDLPVSISYTDSNGKTIETTLPVSLRYRVCLEYTTEVSKNQISDLNSNNSLKNNPTDSSNHEEGRNEGEYFLDALTNGNEDLRNTLEYKKALELELWKSAVEEEYEGRLIAKEEDLMKGLAKEYSLMEQYRKDLFSKKTNDIEKIEKNLRNLLNGLYKREKQMISEEVKFIETKQNYESQMKLFRSELEASAQRKLKDYQQNISLQKQQTEFWKTNAEKSQEKINNLEKELTKTRQLIRGKNLVKIDVESTQEEEKRSLMDELVPMKMEVVKLQIELGATRNDLDAMTRKYQGANSMAQNYRQMWCRALQEISRLKGDSEKHLVEVIRARDAELNRIREDNENKNSSSDRGGDKRKILKGSDQDKILEVPKEVRFEDEVMSDILDNNLNLTMSKNDLIIERLIAERSNLLQSGNYNVTDDLIRDLDDEIKRILGNNSPDQNNNIGVIGGGGPLQLNPQAS